MRTDRVVNCAQIQIPTTYCSSRNITKVLGEGRQVIVGVGAVGDVITRGNCIAHNALIVVEVATGARVAWVVRKGGRRKDFKSIRDKDLELGGVVDGAPLTDMPIGVGTSGNRLRLNSGEVERCYADLFGHYIQEVIGLNRDIDRVIGAIRVGTAGIADECRTAIRGVIRGAQNAC